MRAVFVLALLFFASGCGGGDRAEWSHYTVTATFDRTNAHAPAGHTNEIRSIRKATIWAPSKDAALDQFMGAFKENEPTARNINVKVRRTR